MGRPQELTEEQKRKLLAEGFRPAEVWLPDVGSEKFWDELRREGAAIREADARENMDEILNAFAKDLWNDVD